MTIKEAIDKIYVYHQMIRPQTPEAETLEIEKNFRVAHKKLEECGGVPVLNAIFEECLTEYLERKNK